jgi:hypothetical protein
MAYTEATNKSSALKNEQNARLQQQVRKNLWRFILEAAGD